MFRKVDVAAIPLDSYRDCADASLLEETARLAQAAKGVRLVHLTSAHAPEGVREIARSLVSIARGAGIDSEWQVFEPSQPQFFHTVSRRLWDMAHGADGGVRPEEEQIYVNVNREAASAAPHPQGPGEVWFVHDFPLFPMMQGVNGHGPSLRFWVCHADFTSPNPYLLQALGGLTSSYSGIILASESYRSPIMKNSAVHVIAPAIDPLSPRNKPMGRDEGRALMSKLGLSPARPIMVQVGRFDFWKDPRGVIDGYRVAKMTLPNMQLALLGIVADGDDASRKMLEDVSRYAGGDRDIHVYGDAPSLPAPVDQVINAFQSGADIVAHLSQREGFGLPIAEAMWKGHPVIATRQAGGPLLLIDDEVDGYRVNNVPQLAWRALGLLRDPEMHSKMGMAARQKIRSRFLLPRMFRDYMQLVYTAGHRG